MNSHVSMSHLIPIIVGNTYPTKHNGDLKILERRNSQHVKVRFIDTGYERVTTVSQIRDGSVRDPTKVRRNKHVGAQVKFSVYDTALHKFVSDKASEHGMSLALTATEMLLFAFKRQDFVEALTKHFESLEVRGRVERHSTNGFFAPRYHFHEHVSLTAMDCVYYVCLFEEIGLNSIHASVKLLHRTLFENGVTIAYTPLAYHMKRLQGHGLLLYNTETGKRRDAVWTLSNAFIAAVNVLVHSDYWMMHCNGLYLQIRSQRNIGEIGSAEVHSMP